jgi:hypothetical protein
MVASEKKLDSKVRESLVYSGFLWDCCNCNHNDLTGVLPTTHIEAFCVSVGQAKLCAKQLDRCRLFTIFIKNNHSGPLGLLLRLFLCSPSSSLILSLLDQRDSLFVRFGNGWLFIRLQVFSACVSWNFDVPISLCK